MRSHFHRHHWRCHRCWIPHLYHAISSSTFVYQVETCSFTSNASASALTNCDCCKDFLAWARFNSEAMQTCFAFVLFAPVQYYWLWSLIAGRDWVRGPESFQRSKSLCLDHYHRSYLHWYLIVPCWNHYLVLFWTPNHEFCFVNAWCRRSFLFKQFQYCLYRLCFKADLDPHESKSMPSEHSGQFHCWKYCFHYRCKYCLIEVLTEPNLHFLEFSMIFWAIAEWTIGFMVQYLTLLRTSWTEHRGWGSWSNTSS